MIEQYGIDISTAQGKIDWDKLARNEHLAFVIIRAAQGTAQDSAFDRNIKEALRTDIPFGLYFASGATTEEGVEAEARFAAEFCEAFHPQFGAWFDMELKKHAALGKRKISALLRRWLEIVGETGTSAGVYTNRNWLKNLIEPAVFEKQDGARYPLWYAAYPNIEGKSLTDAWKDNRQKLSYPQAAIWQWTSKGRIDGISTNVDMNVCYEDFAALTGEDEMPEEYVTVEEAARMLSNLGVRGVIL